MAAMVPAFGVAPVTSASVVHPRSVRPAASCGTVRHSGSQRSHSERARAWARSIDREERELLADPPLLARHRLELPYGFDPRTVP